MCFTAHNTVGISMLRDAGDPLLELFGFRDYQDSTILRFRCFGKTLEKPIVLDPRKIQNHSFHHRKIRFLCIPCERTIVLDPRE